MTAITVPEPFPIFRLAHRYLLYDANTVSYIRREYNICGVLIGGLPQAPQQNVFLGLPLELMPEEARLLVEKGVAHIVDDVRSHKRAFLDDGLSTEEKRAYQASMRRQGLGAAREVTKRAGERKRVALKKKVDAENWNDVPEEMLKPANERKRAARRTEINQKDKGTTEDGSEGLLALSTSSSQPERSSDSVDGTMAGPEPYAVTPTTSYPPLQPSSKQAEQRIGAHEASQSYHLFKQVHEQGYFLAPGLRFGCQYMAYPGDPLRFHSHFLCNGMDWDQEFDLLDLVGGGRLGTGVKKGFLIGGLEEASGDAKRHAETKDGGVRAFCIEWGGM